MTRISVKTEDGAAAPCVGAMEHSGPAGAMPREPSMHAFTLLRAFARWLLLLAVLAATTSASAADAPSVRLYAIDCGRLQIADLAPFADTGEYDGHPGTLMASCFLIRHPSGILLWEAGLGDKYANPPDGTKLPLYTAVVPHTLASQLAQINLGYDDIQYFAFSHSHGDHVGNANELKRATWIVDSREIAFWQTVPTPVRVNPALLSEFANVNVKTITGDFDVFGDGTVRMLYAPGHTPGHHVLLVKLRNAGYVLLSGDLFHSPENRANRRMPVFNASRADTLASMDRVEAIVKNTHAKVVIQHSIESFQSLPAFPAYLD
jgi:N-acyl homoserine lactone hydrolase